MLFGRSYHEANFPVDDRNQAMAQRVRESMAKHPGSRLLVLVGNRHAQLRLDDPKPMAWRLRDLRPVSVAVKAMSGAIWACTRSRGCGRLAFDHRDDFANVTVHIKPTKTSTKGYNAILYLPTFSAAPPAKRSVAKSEAD